MNFRKKVFWPATRLLVLLMVLALVLFGLINPALAKGPESVTITGPGIDHKINFVDNNNVDLEVDLMEHTGLWFATGMPLKSEELNRELGLRYTFTWVNSGPPSMTIEERTIIQYVYLDAEAGPIIHTPEQESLQDWGSGVIGWFAAPGDLKETLNELGAPGSSPPAVLEAHMFKTPADTVLAKPTQTGYPWLLIGVGLALLGVVGLFGLNLMKGRIMIS